MHRTSCTSGSTKSCAFPKANTIPSAIPSALPAHTILYPQFGFHPGAFQGVANRQ